MIGSRLARYAIAFAIIALYGEVLGDSDIWNKNHELRDKLLKNYDKNALPQKNVNGTTDIRASLRPRSIWIEEDKQILVVTAWMALIWKDERLKWDYKDYGGLTTAHFGDNEIWKPDFYVYNNAHDSEVDKFGNVHFLVFNSGSVLWVPPARFEVNCPLDLRFWPYDQHNCYVQMGSWTTNGWQLNFELMNNVTNMDTSTLEEVSNNWQILSATQQRVSTTYDCCKEPYIHIDFIFSVKRNSPAFTATVVVPTVVIPLFLMIQFLLPIDHPKRLSIGCCCALLVLMELLFLKISLPKLGTSVPLIVIYYSESFVIVMIIFALSAIYSRLAHPQNPLVAYPPPDIMKRILSGLPARVLGLRNYADKADTNGKLVEEGDVSVSSTSAPFAVEWLFIAEALDRMTAILFTCIFIFSLIGYVSPIK